MFNRAIFRILPLFVGAAVVFSSCDSVEDLVRPTEITFNGVTYAVIGDAEFEQTSEGLKVSNIGSSGNDGVRVATDQAIMEADIRTLPVNLPSNGRWGMQVFGNGSSGRTALATVWNEAVSADEHQIIFEFASEMNVEQMVLEYYLFGELQYSIEVPAGPGSQSLRATPAGRGADGPTSVHVIVVNGEIIVATDHEEEALRSGCSGIILTEVPGAKSPICTDFIQARPITQQTFPEVTSFELTARTLPDFTITSGSVEHPR